MLRVRILLGRGNAQRRNVCSPHGIKGVYTCRYSTGKTHRALWRLFNQHSASGLRKEDPKMKKIKNPNCPSWIRTNKCRSQSPVPYHLAIEHKTLMQRIQTKFCLKSVLIHQCSSQMQTW